MSSGYYRIDTEKMRREERQKRIESECGAIERWIKHFEQIIIRDNLEKFRNFREEYNSFKRDCPPGNEMNESTYSQKLSFLSQFRQKQALLEAANEFEIKVELKLKNADFVPVIEMPADSLDINLKENIEFKEEIKRVSQKQERMQQLKKELKRYEAILEVNELIALKKETDDAILLNRILEIRKEQYMVRKQSEVLLEEIHLLAIFKQEEKRLKDFLKLPVMDGVAINVLAMDIRKKLVSNEVQKACDLERKFREKFGSAYTIHFEVVKHAVDQKGTKGYFLEDKKVTVTGKGANAEFFIDEDTVVDAKELGDGSFCKDMAALAESMGGTWHEKEDVVSRRYSEPKVQRME